MDEDVASGLVIQPHHQHLGQHSESEALEFGVIIFKVVIEMKG